MSGRPKLKWKLGLRTDSIRWIKSKITWLNLFFILNRKSGSRLPSKVRSPTCSLISNTAWSCSSTLTFAFKTGQLRPVRAIGINEFGLGLCVFTRSVLGQLAQRFRRLVLRMSLAAPLSCHAGRVDVHRRASRVRHRLCGQAILQRWECPRPIRCSGWQIDAAGRGV
jgi:hypothetical protein